MPLLVMPNQYKRVKIVFFMEGTVIIDVPTKIYISALEHDIDTYEDSTQDLFTYLQNKYSIILVADESEVENIDNINFDELIIA